MAINPTTGMFYISPEEAMKFYEPIGRGVRGMLGLENEEEFAKRVAADESLSFAERRKLLAENLSPGAFEKAEDRLFKSVERKGKANKILGADKRLSAWSNQFKPNFIQNYVNTYYPEMGTVTTEAEFVKGLTKAVEAGRIKSGSRGTVIRQFKDDIKAEKEKFDTKYEYRDMDEVLRQLDESKASALKSVKDMPGLAKTTTYTSNEQIDSKIQENRQKLEELNKLGQTADAKTIATASPQLIKLRDNLMKEINRLEEEKDKITTQRSYDDLMKILNTK